jgi:hypothetical protein
MPLKPGIVFVQRCLLHCLHRPSSQRGISALMVAGMAARAHKPGPKPGTKKKCKPEGMEEEEWKVEQWWRKSLQQQAWRALTAVQAQQLTAAAAADVETHVVSCAMRGDALRQVIAPPKPSTSGEK